MKLSIDGVHFSTPAKARKIATSCLAACAFIATCSFVADLHPLTYAAGILGAIASYIADYYKEEEKK